MGLERRLQTAVQQPLRAAERRGRPRGEVCGESRRLGLELAVGQHAGDDPEIEGLGGGQHAVRQRQLERRACRPDEPRQEPARRAVGCDADSRVGHHELGRLTGEDEVGRADEADARAGRAALDRGDDRRVEANQRRDRNVQRRRDLTQVVRQRVALLPKVLTSPPPQKPGAAPVRSTDLTAGSSAIASAAASSSRAIVRSMALAASGRFSVRCATASRTSRVMVS